MLCRAILGPISPVVILLLPISVAAEAANHSSSAQASSASNAAVEADQVRPVDEFVDEVHQRELKGNAFLHFFGIKTPAEVAAAKKAAKNNKGQTTTRKPGLLGGMFGPQNNKNKAVITGVLSGAALATVAGGIAIAVKQSQIAKARHEGKPVKPLFGVGKLREKETLPTPAPHVVSSHLTKWVRPGEKKLSVAKQSEFTKGQNIVIEKGTLREEIRRVVSFGSLILDRPLDFPHAAKVTVATVPAKMLAPLLREEALRRTPAPTPVTAAPADAQADQIPLPVWLAIGALVACCLVALLAAGIEAAVHKKSDSKSRLSRSSRSREALRERERQEELEAERERSVQSERGSHYSDRESVARSQQGYPDPEYINPANRNMVAYRMVSPEELGFTVDPPDYHVPEYYPGNAPALYSDYAAITPINAYEYEPAQYYTQKEYPGHHSGHPVTTNRYDLQPGYAIGGYG